MRLLQPEHDPAPFAARLREDWAYLVKVAGVTASSGPRCLTAASTWP